MPTGHYARTAAHGAAISAAQKRRFASMSPEATARHLENFAKARQSPNRRPPDPQKSVAAKKRWWAELSSEDRVAFVAKRGASLSKFYSRQTPAWRRQRFATARKAGAEATKAMWATLSKEEKRVKLAKAWAGAAATGYAMTPEHEAALRTGRANTPMSEATRAQLKQKLPVAQAKRWAQVDRESRLRHTEPGRVAARLANPSSIEIAITKVLESIGVAYISQHPIGPYIADLFLPDLNMVIECDGSYWHGLPGRVEKDRARDAWMVSRGFKVVRLSEPDIRSGKAGEQLLRLIS